VFKILKVKVAQAALYNGDAAVVSHSELAIILQEENGSPAGPPVGAIVGGVLGGVAFLGLIAGFFVYRNRQNKLAAASLTRPASSSAV